MKKTICTSSRLRSIQFIALGLTFLTISLASAQNTEIQQAKYFQDVDQPTKGLDVLNKAAQTYPTSAAVQYYLGMAQLKAGQRDLALKSFDKGISIDEKDGLNYAGKGTLSMMEVNPTKAKLDFDKALSVTKSKNVAVLQAVAEGYLVDTKMANQAMELLNKAKSIDDHNTDTWILLGDAFLKLNNGGQSVSSYERAASLDAKLPKPHYKIGLVYLRSRNYPAAQEAFIKAIQLDPGYTLAYKELGENYYGLKQSKKAVEAYEKYLSLTEKPEAGKLRMAFFYFMDKNYAKANPMFEEMVKKPDAPNVGYRFYAVSLYEAGDSLKAKDMFDKYFVKAKPEEIEANDYAYYGNLLKMLHQDSLAVAAYQKSLDLDPKQTELLQKQAQMYYGMKKYEDAIAAYEKLRVAKTKWASTDLYTVGRAYYFNSQNAKLDTATKVLQLQKADTTFSKLVEAQPNMVVSYSWSARTKASLDPETTAGLAKPVYEKLVEKALATPEKNKKDLVEAYSYLGYYHFLKNERPAAKTYYEKILAIDPTNERAKVGLKELNTKR